MGKAGGQHLLTSKLISSKSLESVDYFSYLWHTHISSRFEYILHFLQKIALLLTLDPFFHMNGFFSRPNCTKRNYFSTTNQNWTKNGCKLVCSPPNHPKNRFSSILVVWKFWIYRNVGNCILMTPQTGTSHEIWIQMSGNQSFFWKMSGFCQKWTIL